jgi:hypothetical protein
LAGLIEATSNKGFCVGACAAAITATAITAIPNTNLEDSHAVSPGDACSVALKCVEWEGKSNCFEVYSLLERTEGKVKDSLQVEGPQTVIFRWAEDGLRENRSGEESDEQ